MKLSIIIPVYNSSPFLEHSVSTILEQLESDMELILIDDCSLDNSYEICKSLAKKDKRIKVLKNKVNKGICYTRNVGLKNATGEYVAFCDDDDEWGKDLVKDQLEIIRNNPEVDMIKFGRSLVLVNSANQVISTEETSMKVTGMINENEKYCSYFKIRPSKSLVNVWNGFYKLQMLKENHIYFDESMKYGSEDALFSFDCFMHSKSIYFNPKVYYIHYKRNLSSTSRKFNRNKIDSIIKTAKKEEEIWHKVDLGSQENQSSKVLAVQGYLNNVMIDQAFHPNSNITYTERKEIYEKFKRELMENHFQNNHVKKELWKKNKKHYLLYKILKGNHYKFIDIFYKLSAKKINRKWR